MLYIYKLYDYFDALSVVWGSIIHHVMFMMDYPGIGQKPPKKPSHKLNLHGHDLRIFWSCLSLFKLSLPV